MVVVKESVRLLTIIPPWSSRATSVRIPASLLYRNVAIQIKKRRVRKRTRNNNQKVEHRLFTIQLICLTQPRTLNRKKMGGGGNWVNLDEFLSTCFVFVLFSLLFASGQRKLEPQICLIDNLLLLEIVWNKVSMDISDRNIGFSMTTSRITIDHDHFQSKRWV